MGAYTLTPDTTFIEPRAAIPAPRRFFHTFQQEALTAPDSIFGIWLGQLPPWSQIPLWVDIRTLKIGCLHGAADAVTFFVDYSVGDYDKGWVALEPKTFTGGISFNALCWDTPVLTTGACGITASGGKGPYLRIEMDNTDNFDDFYLYLDGTFFELFDSQAVQRVNLDGYTSPIRRVPRV